MITYLSAQDGDSAVVTVRTYCIAHMISPVISSRAPPPSFPYPVRILVAEGANFPFTLEKARGGHCKYALPLEVLHLCCVDCKNSHLSHVNVAYSKWRVQVIFFL